MSYTLTPVADRMMSQAAVIDAFGFTAGLIRKYLGEPDSTAPNPVHPDGAPMCLYSLRRIQAAVQGDPELERRLYSNRLRRGRGGRWTQVEERVYAG